MKYGKDAWIPSTMPESSSLESYLPKATGTEQNSVRMSHSLQVLKRGTDEKVYSGIDFIFV